MEEQTVSWQIYSNTSVVVVVVVVVAHQVQVSSALSAPPTCCLEVGGERTLRWLWPSKS